MFFGFYLIRDFLFNKNCNEIINLNNLVKWLEYLF